MPVYNVDKYISAAICSILTQTYTDLKLIILDDGSTDNSLKTANAFALLDSRIQVKSHDKNEGIPKTRDDLISYVDTEYFAWMDADDISLPHRFRMQIDYLDAHPGIGAVSSGYMCYKSLKKYLPETDPDKIAVNLLTANGIVNPASMVRSQVFKETGFSFQKCGVSSATDYASWVSIRDISRIKVLPECLLIYRLHDCQESSANSKIQQDSAKKIIAQQLSSLGLNVSDINVDDLAIFDGDNPSHDSFIKIGRLYMRLIKMNQETGIFNQQHLISSLSARYMSYCKFFGLSGVFTYLKFMGFKTLLDKRNFGFDFLVRCLTYQAK